MKVVIEVIIEVVNDAVDKVDSNLNVSWISK